MSVLGDQTIDLLLVSHHTLDQQLRIRSYRWLRVLGPIREQARRSDATEVGFEEDVQSAFSGLTAGRHFSTGQARPR